EESNWRMFGAISAWKGARMKALPPPLTHKETLLETLQRYNMVQGVEDDLAEVKPEEADSGKEGDPEVAPKPKMHVLGPNETL
ncbi:hypothetical protein PQX77_006967, partial [Marasmius sp. AFHP31]